METHLPIKLRLRAHLSLHDTLEGLYLQQLQRDTQANAGELFGWQPDRVGVRLQIDPSCWHMCGNDHPLRRYVLLPALCTSDCTALTFSKAALSRLRILRLTHLSNVSFFYQQCWRAADFFFLLFLFSAHEWLLSTWLYSNLIEISFRQVQ